MCCVVLALARRKRPHLILLLLPALGANLVDQVNVLESGGSQFRFLYLFGDVLLSIDEHDVLRGWLCAPPQRSVCEMSVGTPTNRVTCLLHPDTYLNKLLCGREDGSFQARESSREAPVVFVRMPRSSLDSFAAASQLWNIKTFKMIHSFAGWGSAVVSMAQSPAIDVVALGLVRFRSPSSNSDRRPENVIVRCDRATGRRSHRRAQHSQRRHHRHVLATRRSMTIHRLSNSRINVCSHLRLRSRPWRFAPTNDLGWRAATRTARSLCALVVLVARRTLLLIA